MPPADQVVARVLPHLLALDQLCKTHGARLVVVLPPVLSRDDASADVRLSAAGNNISVLVPFGPGELSPESFRDGFHLNPHGAARFTERLGSALNLTLSSH